MINEVNYIYAIFVRNKRTLMYNNGKITTDKKIQINAYTLSKRFKIITLLCLEIVFLLLYFQY